MALLATTGAVAQTPDTAPPLADQSDASTLQRDAAQETFLRLVEEKRYDEAVSIAGQIVAITSRLYGDQSLELAGPLVNLATAQMRRGDLTAAADNYQASIAIIERRDGIGSPRLINPLVGLGETYVRSALYLQANDAYQRALQLNHAATGFYNVEQFKILDGLSESYLGLEKLADANFQQRAQVAIQQRRSGPDSPEIVPALYKLGSWYSRTGQYQESREYYQIARRILRESKGDNDPALVDAYLGEARSYENEGAWPAAVSALKKALEIVERQPQPDHKQRAEVLVALGDLYTIFDRPKSARERYVQAWQELSGDDALIASRNGYFAQPAQIAGPVVPSIAGNGDDDKAGNRGRAKALAPGYVLAGFSVDAQGRPGNLVIVESDPPGLMDKSVITALNSSAFRPRMSEGEPVTSENVQLRHEFRYVRPPAGAKPPASPSPGSAGEMGEPIGYPDKPESQDGNTRP